MRSVASFAFVAVASVFLGGPASAGDRWSYESTTDKMSGKSMDVATLASQDSLNLPFPYAGTNYAHLMIRRHPQYGLDVIYSVQKGQILCPSYSGCTVKVKFGDKAPVSFSASPSDDRDTTYVFLRDAKRFIASAKSVDSFLIQPPLYKGGAAVSEFRSTDKLVWPPKK